MKFTHALLIVLATVLTGVPAVGQIELESSAWTVQFDPETLAISAEVPGGDRLQISAGQHGLGQAGYLHGTHDQISWSLPDCGLTLRAVMRGDRLTLHFTSDKPGKINWPIIPANHATKAYILPMFEGIYAPTNDPDWIDHLVNYGPMDTAADLSMPFIGLDLGNCTLTYIFENMFDNQIVFKKGGSGGAGHDVSVTHTFMPNWDKWEYAVVIQLGEASPIAPAKAYREYLIERGEFITMAEKIKTNPNAERLLGAPHAYLWDAGLFSHLDATDWKGFATKLIEEGSKDDDTLGKRIWDSFDDEAKQAAVEITQAQWPYKYVKGVVASAVSAYLEDGIGRLANVDPRRNMLDRFCEHFAGLVRPYDTWGDGISVKMLNTLHDAGLEKMLLCLGDLSCADLKPEAARRADELGYLFGPYDSYHSIHPPQGHPKYDPNNTWETAQFPPELYETGPIVKADGTKSAGFKKVGYHLSPSAARPYVEARVNDYLARVPHTAVFVDCDAFGQFFDDYSPDHPATKQQDMLERLDRMSWLTTRHGLVVGSEGGSGYAAPAIHFAHGMLTPVIGWGDTDLKDKTSPYYMGGYWPPDGPATYTKQVPLKPKFKKFFYDPAYRLPLYQTVFHDSVIATHHWGNASLKFKDQVQTVALLEQLYNVPPLYHLNHEEFKKHKKHILAHHAFFSPLHRELALQPMTGFDWMTDDRLIQRTRFGDGTLIIANFGDQSTTIHGHDLPAKTVIAIRPDAELMSYSPE